MASPGMAYGERRFEAAYTVRIIVGLVVSGILVGLWAGQSDARPATHPALLWVSIGLIAGFVGLCVAISKTLLIINDAGVRTESVFGQKEIAWSQITHTRYRVVPINVYAHLGLIGALLAMSSKSGRAQLTLQLIGDDGKQVKVTAAFRKSSEAIGLILARVLPGMVASAKAKVQRGETVKFGGVGLSATAVTWKGSSIPLPEITKAEIAGPNLQLKRQGKWLSAISVRSDKVPDVLVFLEVLESVAPQIKATGIDPLARVRV
jgi:hypothetical protein